MKQPQLAPGAHRARSGWDVPSLGVTHPGEPETTLCLAAITRRPKALALLSCFPGSRESLREFIGPIAAIAIHSQRECALLPVSSALVIRPETLDDKRRTAAGT
jgi:hypothetical protein